MSRVPGPSTIAAFRLILLLLLVCLAGCLSWPSSVGVGSAPRPPFEGVKAGDERARLPGGSDPDLSSTRRTANRDGTYSRVRRGGAWDDDGWPCRSTFRLRYEPERRSDHIGFRVVAVQP